MTELQDLGPQILLGDLAGGGPASLAVDGIDLDWFAGSIARFVEIGFVKDAETTRLSLCVDAPGLAEWLKGLETPSGGRDGTEGYVLAHGCLWLVGVGTPGIRKCITADSYQKAAVGSGRLILFGGFLPPHIG